jgi:methylphosphotriester-DNA--protein-cysteine methyltransferase
VTYILNSNPDSMVFHKPSCYWGSIIREEFRIEFYGTREEVIEMGYRPCGHCHP